MNLTRPALVLAAALLLAAPAAAKEDYAARVAKVLKATPLIDGHNDWAEALREREGDGRWTIDLTSGLDKRREPYNTDIAMLRRGMVGGQFWSVFVSPSLPIAPVAFFGWRLWLLHRIGGISGDGHGAGIEITESLLLFAALVWTHIS